MTNYWPRLMSAAFLKSFVHLLQASEMGQSAKETAGQTGQAVSKKADQAKQVGQQSCQSMSQKVYIVQFLCCLRLQWGQQAAVLLPPGCGVGWPANMPRQPCAQPLLASGAHT